MLTWSLCSKHHIQPLWVTRMAVGCFKYLASKILHNKTISENPIQMCICECEWWMTGECANHIFLFPAIMIIEPLKFSLPFIHTYSLAMKKSCSAVIGFDADRMNKWPQCSTGSPQCCEKKTWATCKFMSLFHNCSWKWIWIGRFGRILKYLPNSISFSVTLSLFLF